MIDKKKKNKIEFIFKILNFCNPNFSFKDIIIYIIQ